MILFCYSFFFLLHTITLFIVLFLSFQSRASSCFYVVVNPPIVAPFLDFLRSREGRRMRFERSPQCLVEEGRTILAAIHVVRERRRLRRRRSRVLKKAAIFSRLMPA